MDCNSTIASLFNNALQIRLCKGKYQCNKMHTYIPINFMCGIVKVCMQVEVLSIDVKLNSLGESAFDWVNLI